MSEPEEPIPQESEDRQDSKLQSDILQEFPKDDITKTDTQKPFNRDENSKTDGQQPHHKGFNKKSNSQFSRNYNKRQHPRQAFRKDFNCRPNIQQISYRISPEQKPRGVPIRACGCCSMTWKWVHYCPAENRICQACGKIGHFAKVCRSADAVKISTVGWKNNNNNKDRRRGDDRRHQVGDNQSKDQEHNQNKNADNLNEGETKNESENENNGQNHNENSNNDGTLEDDRNSSENRQKTFNNSGNFNNNRKNNNRRFNSNKDNNKNWKNQRRNRNRNFRVSFTDDCKNKEKKPLLTENEFRNNDQFDSKHEELSSVGENESNDISNMSRQNNHTNPNNDCKQNQGPRTFNRSGQKNNRNVDENKNRRDDSPNNNGRERNSRRRHGNFPKSCNSDKNHQNNSKNPHNDSSNDEYTNDQNNGKKSTKRNNNNEECNDDNKKEFQRKTVYPTYIGQTRYNSRADNSNEENDFYYNKDNNHSDKGKFNNCNKSNRNADNGSSDYYLKAQNQYDSICLKRSLAHSFFLQGKYDSALSHYSRLIELCPKDAIYYNNRCACFIMLQQYEEAFADANIVIQLDPSNTKGYCRLIKCAILLGHTMSAEFYLGKLSQIDPTNADIIVAHTKLDQLETIATSELIPVNCNDFQNALDRVNNKLRISPYCNDFKTKKAEYLTMLKRYEEAQIILDEILKKDSNNLEANYISGIHLYYKDIEKSLAHFESILKYNVDHIKVMEFYRRAKKIIGLKKKANLNFALNRFSEAHDIYSLILKIDPDHTVVKMNIYYNMGQVSMNLGDFERAIGEYTESLKINSSEVDALKQRGKCYMNMQEYEDAIADFTRVCNLDPDDDCRPLILQAEKLLAAIEKDPFKILGVSRQATADDIRKAYRQKAMLHHPDRHSQDTLEQRLKHERKFKCISHAYQYLFERCNTKEKCAQ